VFFFALAHPERVGGSSSSASQPGSGAAIARHRAMPFQWPPWHPNRWRMIG
jgi:hypothetical protein